MVLVTTETDEMFQELISAAIRFRYAVYHANGMATKSGVEDWLIYHYGISRDLGHEVMNRIEANQLDSVVWNGWRGDDPEPTMADYPEVVLVGKLRKVSIVNE